ncbi:MAG: DUF2628 domain-containing protein [Pseudomonadota bacterium]
MKLFNIYVKKSETDTIEDLVVVKSNFSYLAFLFGILWFLQHKMWKEAACLTLIDILLIIIGQKGLFGSFDILAIEFGLLLIVGLNAGYWYEQYLRKHNYQFVGNVFGKNKDEAKLHFISNCFKSEDQDFCPSIISIKQRKNPSQYFTT